MSYIDIWLDVAFLLHLFCSSVPAPGLPDSTDRIPNEHQIRKPGSHGDGALEAASLPVALPAEGGRSSDSRAAERQRTTTNIVRTRGRIV
ncbi:unnamed protein product [Merluccius merluccius]